MDSDGGEDGRLRCGVGLGEVSGEIKLRPTDPAAEDGSSVELALSDGRRDPDCLPAAEPSDTLRSRVEGDRPATNMRG